MYFLLFCEISVELLIKTEQQQKKIIILMYKEATSVLKGSRKSFKKKESRLKKLLSHQRGFDLHEY